MMRKAEEWERRLWANERLALQAIAAEIVKRDSDSIVAQHI